MVTKSGSTQIKLTIQSNAEHISEDRMDGYVLETLLDGTSDSSIEQHLRCCHTCQARMKEAWEFIQALRQTIRKGNVLSQHSSDHGISVNQLQVAPLV